MIDTQPKKILILGGYGRAGFEIAKLMAVQTDYEILIGGRTLTKADHAVKQLSHTYPKSHFEAVEIDIAKGQTVLENVPNVDLVIVAIPLNYENALTLIDAVLQSSKTHYIDLSPSDKKHQAFTDRSEQIDNGDHIFILDAGFEPGLPGFMARWALSELENPEDLIIEGVYRDPNIPKGGIKDIISHNEPAYILQKGEIKKASPFKMKITEFPYEFGKAISIPIWMPELQSIPSKYNLKNMVYYHAGVNGVANVVMLSWQMIFNIFLPIEVGVNIFKWAIQKFTRKPFGGVIRVAAESLYLKKELIITHHELYQATAIPIVASTIQLLSVENKKKGKFFLGEYVNEKLFLKHIRELGMQLQVKQRKK